MTSNAKCIHIDTCTVDYINDHSGLLLGVHVDSDSTWADVRRDLIDQILDQGDDLTKDQMKWAVKAAETYFEERWKPNELEEAQVVSIDPEDDDGFVSAWFRIIFN